MPLGLAVKSLVNCGLEAKDSPRDLGPVTRFPRLLSSYLQGKVLEEHSSVLSSYSLWWGRVVGRGCNARLLGTSETERWWAFVGGEETHRKGKPGLPSYPILPSSPHVHSSVPDGNRVAESGLLYEPTEAILC